MFYQSWPVKMAYVFLFCRYINWAIFSLAHPPPPPAGEEVFGYDLNRYVPVNRVQFSGSEGLHALLHILYSKESKFTPLLKALHWLSVAYWIVFKILLLTLKAIHKLALTYISKLVSLKDSGGNYLRSNGDKLLNIQSCSLFLDYE